MEPIFEEIFAEDEYEIEPCCGGCSNTMSSCTCFQDTEEEWERELYLYREWE